MADPPLTERRAGASGVRRTRIAALIHLLGDESPKVYTAARDHLQRIGAAALEPLRHAAAESPDGGVRARAGELLCEWGRRDVLDRWRELCSSGNLALEEGAVVIARSEYPEESAEKVAELLDGYAAVLKKRIGTARTTETAVRRLSQLMAGELGFTGRRVDQDDPDACYLTRVLESRKGVPILLATAYLCVARRVGLEVAGVGLPSHFLLKYATRRGVRFVDPFHDGETLSRRDCRAFLEKQGITFHQSFVREVSDREILSRMLGKLLRLYHAREDYKRLARVIGMLGALDAEPGYPHPR